MGTAASGQRGWSPHGRWPVAWDAAGPPARVRWLLEHPRASLVFHSALLVVASALLADAFVVAGLRMAWVLLLAQLPMLLVALNSYRVLRRALREWDAHRHRTSPIGR